MACVWTIYKTEIHLTNVTNIVSFFSFLKLTQAYSKVDLIIYASESCNTLLQSTQKLVNMIWKIATFVLTHVSNEDLICVCVCGGALIISPSPITTQLSWCDLVAQLKIRLVFREVKAIKYVHWVNSLKVPV